MSFLPEVKEGTIVFKPKRIKVKKIRTKPRKKGTNPRSKGTNPRKIGKKNWREYYKSIEFIRNL